ncbi:MAG: bifunctional diaminohydroxyphosphoribosylaminopyrimidine deaminase/5-amino-6-(5-phosphoribosylamino)uracil reductase RibD [Acidimicrobiia bacterium]
MSRRALSDNRARAAGPGDAATVADGAPDALFMQRAVDLARPEQPHPNPRVGAVIVDSTGQLIAEGAHVRAGEPHAEAIALARAGVRAAGSTVYVTLEPCSHYGRTPPCTSALVAAGVRRVVVGSVDPDRRVRGSGVDELRSAGIDVATGVLADEVEAMDPGYFHHRRTGRPLVTLKLAITLDGQLAAADGTSQWITGEAARHDAHRLRAESDVIIVGAGTVHADNPRLDVRLDGYRGRHPRPVVVAGTRPLPTGATVLTHDPLVYSPRPVAIAVEHVVQDRDGKVDIGAMIEDLGNRGYVTALVEGGAQLADAMVRGGHVDRIVFYIAAKLGLGVGLPAFPGVFATVTDALPLVVDSVRQVGDDLRIETKVGR